MEIFTVKELRVKAKALKIKGIYSMRKAELISAIEQVEKSAHAVSEPVAEKQAEKVIDTTHEIVITNTNGVLTTSSVQVAKDFEKRLSHVNEAIESLIEGCAEKSADLFIESSYQHPQNKQWYKCYEITRDGFSLLVMGFTGKKALEWKLKYIEAFNKMEQAIISGHSSDMQALISCFEKFSERLDALENRQKRLETKSAGFTPPTVREVEDYCDCLGEWIDAERFVDYYESVGWVIGNGKPMKDWKASVRCWLRYEA